MSPKIKKKKSGVSSGSSAFGVRTTRSSSSKHARGESPAKTNTSGHEEIDLTKKLPQCLYTAHRYPVGGRLNIYSKPEYLGFLAEILKGTESWDSLMNSQFRHLFELPVARTMHSGKLIHGLLSRQLVTKKEKELWVLFGGQPMRFSLREFHIITGLLCHKTPSDADIEAHQDPSYLSVWNRLFGDKKIVFVVEVVEMLRQDSKRLEGQPRLTEWKRLCFALILLIDGVIVCSSNDNAVTNKYVEMLHDVDFFMSFPWGRLSFSETIERFGPPSGVDHQLRDLKTRLQQKTSVCYGFPLSIQLQALQSIDAICQKIKKPDDLRNFIELGSEHIGGSILLRAADVLEAESKEDLRVLHTLQPLSPLKEEDFLWPGEKEDPKVDFMLSLINGGHVFKPQDWADGDSSLPLLRPLKSAAPTLTSEPPLSKKKSKQKTHVIPEKPAKKPSTSSSIPNIDEFGLPSSKEWDAMKGWMLEQNQLLRTNIVNDVKKLLANVPCSTPKGVRKSSTKRKRNQSTIHMSLSSDSEPHPNQPQSSKFPSPQQDTHRWEDYGVAYNITRGINNFEADGVDEEEHEVPPRTPDVQQLVPDVQDPPPDVQEPPLDVQESPLDVQQSVPDVQDTVPDVQDPIDVVMDDVHDIQSRRQPEEMVDGAIDKDGNIKGPDVHTDEMVDEEMEEKDNIHLPDVHDEPEEGIKGDKMSGPVESDVVDDENNPGRTTHVPFPDLNSSADQPSITPGVHEEEVLQHAEDVEAPDVHNVMDGVSENVQIYDNEVVNLSTPSFSKAITASSSAYFTLETIKPRQPLPKRIPKRSRFLDDSEYTADPRLKNLFASRTKPPGYKPISAEPDEKEFDTFVSLLAENKDQTYGICTGHNVSNALFLEVAKKNAYLSTEHMQLIISMLVRQRCKSLELRRSVLLDPWFVCLLQTLYEEFKKCDAPDSFDWGVNIKAYVTGKSTGRLMRSDFVKHVDIVYVPMEWGEKKWVGLVIDLKVRQVLIIDPLLDEFEDFLLFEQVAPITNTLPALLNKFCGIALSTPFTVEYQSVKYDHEGDGDSGIVVAKLLEMHAYGDKLVDLSGFTDGLVSSIRKVYAMDLYGEFVGAPKSE